MCKDILLFERCLQTDCDHWNKIWLLGNTLFWKENEPDLCTTNDPLPVLYIEFTLYIAVDYEHLSEIVVDWLLLV
jgi:hypothetical protein